MLLSLSFGSFHNVMWDVRRRVDYNVMWDATMTPVMCDAVTRFIQPCKTVYFIRVLEKKLFKNLFHLWVPPIIRLRFFFFSFFIRCPLVNFSVLTVQINAE